MREKNEAQRFAESAPAMDEQELEKINGLFPTYIFRRKRTRELWTTCCRRYIKLPNPALQSPAEEEVMAAVHQREPDSRWDEPPAEDTPCPYCGKKVIVKELGRTGNRDNLAKWRRAVTLKWDGKALWARAYDCGKTYPAEAELTDPPSCSLVGVYRFRPGLTEGTHRVWSKSAWHEIARQTGPLEKGKWNVHGPFYANGEYGVGYSVIGLDAVDKSPFRYCGTGEYGRRYPKVIEFLEACCFYPRQIEMLMKAHMHRVVFDLVERGVKNNAAINWDDPGRGLRLNGQEVKEFLQTRRDVDTITLYRALKGRAAIAECDGWIARGLSIRSAQVTAKKWNVPLERMIRYLDGHCGGSGSNHPDIGGTLVFWQDYLRSAEDIGWPLHQENVLMPKDLGAAHDEAVRLRIEKARRERAAEERERARLRDKSYKKRRAKLEKKYAFALDGYIIRVPANEEEIRDEGRKLKHCVGGYAQRHMQGTTTILFMRKAKQPDKPWLTIEMDVNKLRQIHGFRNEGMYSTGGRIAPDPREVYREFLDTWLEWLKDGSRRNKQGEPIIRPRKQAAGAA